VADALAYEVLGRLCHVRRSLLAAKTPTLRLDTVRGFANLLEPHQALKERLAPLRRSTALVPIEAPLNLVIELRQRKFGKDLLVGDLEDFADHLPPNG
jgi:hypothetical protein